MVARSAFALLCRVAVAGLVAACSASPDASPQDSADPTADQDGDGLTDAYEREIGADPAAADTDGDGCDDAIEVLTYFDPLDASDRPYTGGYPRFAPPTQAHFDAMAEESGEGFGLGQLNENWRLTDRHGEEVELRDFAGQVIVVDLASEWCGPCVAIAPYVEEFYQEHRDEGFVVLQILLEGVVNNAEPDAGRWSDTHEVTYPVMVDHSPGDRFVTEVAQDYIVSDSPSYNIPNYSVLGRDHRIERLYATAAPGDAELRELLDAPWPESAPTLPDDAEALREALGLPDGGVVGPEVCDR